MATSSAQIYAEFQAVFTGLYDASEASLKWINAYVTGISTASSLPSLYSLSAVPLANRLAAKSYIEGIFNSLPSSLSDLAEAYWNAQALIWGGSRTVWPGPPSPVEFALPSNPDLYVENILNKAEFIANMEAYLAIGVGSPLDFFTICYNRFIMQIVLSNLVDMVI